MHVEYDVADCRHTVPTALSAQRPRLNAAHVFARMTIAVRHMRPRWRHGQSAKCTNLIVIPIWYLHPLPQRRVYVWESVYRAWWWWASKWSRFSGEAHVGIFSVAPQAKRMGGCRARYECERMRGLNVTEIYTINGPQLIIICCGSNIWCATGRAIWCMMMRPSCLHTIREGSAYKVSWCVDY